MNELAVLVVVQLGAVDVGAVDGRATVAVGAVAPEEEAVVVVVMARKSGVFAGDEDEAIVGESGALKQPGL